MSNLATRLSLQCYLPAFLRMINKEKLGGPPGYEAMVSKSINWGIVYIHLQFNFFTLSELEISFEESTVNVVEGMTATATLRIDSGILVGNLTFNITDGTASSTSNYTNQSKL